MHRFRMEFCPANVKMIFELSPHPDQQCRCHCCCDCDLMSQILQVVSCPLHRAPPLPIHWPGKWTGRTLHAIQLKCVCAPACWRLRQPISCVWGNKVSQHVQVHAAVNYVLCKEKCNNDCHSWVHTIHSPLHYYGHGQWCDVGLPNPKFCNCGG
jgi:hypothetical protein